MGKKYPPKGPGDDSVGYGKPPKSSQFKSGQSGNPNGRPKGGSKDVSTQINNIGDEKVTCLINGVSCEVTKFEAAIRHLFDLAVQGSTKHLDKIIEYKEKQDAQKAQASFGTLYKETDSISVDPSQAYEEMKKRNAGTTFREAKDMYEKALGRKQRSKESDLEYASAAYFRMIKRKSLDKSQ